MGAALSEVSVLLCQETCREQECSALVLLVCLSCTSGTCSVLVRGAKRRTKKKHTYCLRFSHPRAGKAMYGVDGFHWARKRRPPTHDFDQAQVQNNKVYTQQQVTIEHWRELISQRNDLREVSNVGMHVVL